MRASLVIFPIIGSIIVLFLLVPIVICLGLGAPHVTEVFHDREAVKALYLSLHAGLTSSLLITLSGVPLAYSFSRRKTTVTKVVESLLEIPLALPHSVAGIMVLVAYNSRAPIGSLLARLGLVVEDSYWGIVFAMAFVSAPIFITTMRAGFDSVDVELENVARTLGASGLETFFTVSLPLALRHLVAGFVLSFARGISEVGAVMIVAYYPKVAAVLVIERFLEYGLSAAMSLSAALALMSLVIFVALRLVTKRGG